MVRRGYCASTKVLLFERSTDVLLFRNVRPIGRRDRSWQSPSVKRKAITNPAQAWQNVRVC
jgi:hypothetical protein